MTTRKQFIVHCVGGGLGLMLGACGGGGDDPPPATPAAPASACGALSFSANHGHTLTLTQADLDSTTSRTFDVQGTAPHTHQVTLTPAQLAALKAGQSVSVTTSLDATHSHDLSGTCR